MWTPRRHRTAAVHRPTTDRHDQKNLALPSSSIQPQNFNKIITPKAKLNARKRRKNVILPRAWTSWLAGSNSTLRKLAKRSEDKEERECRKREDAR